MKSATSSVTARCTARTYVSCPQRGCRIINSTIRRRQLCTPAALPFSQLFDPVRAPFDPSIRRRLETRPMRDELLELLLQQPEGGASASRISELVEGLSEGGTPFDEQQLAGGPWQVLYTTGRVQLWKATYDYGKRVTGRKNEASQDVDPKKRTVLNRADYIDNVLFVTAQGTYLPDETDTPGITPAAITVTITSGTVNAWGKVINLPIQGTGKFEVAYLDEDLRIFQSQGSIAVQVRKSSMTSV